MIQQKCKQFTESFNKLPSSLLNVEELNVVTGVSLRKSVFHRWRHPRTPEHDVSHFLLQKPPNSTQGLN